MKHRFNEGRAADLYFWRDHVGHEVDVVYEGPQGLQAMEIKSGGTFAADWPAAVYRFQQLSRDASRDAAPAPIIVFGGEGRFERESCRVLGWREFVNL